jgi:hypothetical protein
MDQNAAGRGPNWGLLLLVPAVVIVAKAAMHRRAMWESRWGASGTAGQGHGRHARFGGEGAAGPGAFRLPPKIEWMLDTWHTRAHQEADSTEPSTTSAKGPADDAA